MNRQCAWETNSQVPFKSTQQGFNTWATLLSHDALFPHTELERQEPIPVRKIKEVCFSAQIFVDYHTSVKSLLKQASTATQWSYLLNFSQSFNQLSYFVNWGGKIKAYTKFGQILSICSKDVDGNEILTSIKGHNTIINKQNTTDNNPNQDLVNKNAYIKFGGFLSIFSQNMVLEQDTFILA